MIGKNITQESIPHQQLLDAFNERNSFRIHSLKGSETDLNGKFRTIVAPAERNVNHSSFSSMDCHPSPDSQPDRKNESPSINPINTCNSFKSLSFTIDNLIKKLPRNDEMNTDETSSRPERSFDSWNLLSKQTRSSMKQRIEKSDAEAFKATSNKDISPNCLPMSWQENLAPIQTMAFPSPHPFGLYSKSMSALASSMGFQDSSEDLSKFNTPQDLYFKARYISGNLHLTPIMPFPGPFAYDMHLASYNSQFSFVPIPTQSPHFA